MELYTKNSIMLDLETTSTSRNIERLTTTTANQCSAGVYSAYKLVNNCKRMYSETFATRRKRMEFLKALFGGINLKSGDLNKLQIKVLYSDTTPQYNLYCYFRIASGNQ